MLVEIKMDPMGGLVLTPENKRIRSKIANLLEEYGIDNSHGSAYVDPITAEVWLDTCAPKTKAKMVAMGHRQTIRIDSFYFGQLVGYDAEWII